MNITIGLIALVLAGLWAISLWTDHVFEEIDPFEIDEDF